MGVCENGHTSTGAKFCPQCGAKVGTAAAEPAGTVCVDCGTRSTSNFCPECGKKKGTPPAKASNFCEKCGKESSVKFCPNCGNPKLLPAGSAAPTTPTPTPSQLNVPGLSREASVRTVPGPRSPALASSPSPTDLPEYDGPKQDAVCAACGLRIAGRVLLALEETWHPACFTCVHCLKPQEGCPFYVQDNNIYCQKDHDDLFALKCHACKGIIDGSYLRVPILGQIFHPDCLVCSKCKGPLKNKPFFCDDNSDEILCREDYDNRGTTVRCSHCRDYIQGAVVLAQDGKKYHNKCYNTLNPLSAEEARQKQSNKQREIEFDELPEEKEEEETVTLAAPSTVPRGSAGTETKQAPGSPRASSRVGGVTTPRLDLGAPMSPRAASATRPEASTPKAGAKSGPGAAPATPKAANASANMTRDGAAASFIGGVAPSATKQDMKSQHLPPTRESSSLPDPRGSVSVSRASTVEDPSTRQPNKTLSLAQQRHQLVDAEDAIPFITHGLKYVLHASQDTSEVFVPDYRKKEMYKLVLNDKKYDFQTYSPSVFHCVRTMYGITHDLFTKSLTETGISGGKLGDGKSGMLFFYSNDRRFVIKTVTRAEIFFFKSIMRNYLTHVVKNKHTLLPRFFGAYKITLPEQRKLRLVVMNNLYETTCKLDEKFDLKGSTRNRFVDVEKHGRGGVLKDLNFTDAMWMGTTQKRAVMTQLKKDTQWLVEQNVMDQSLLLGIHNGGKPVTTDKEYKPVDLPDFNKPLAVRIKGLTDLDSCFQRFKGGIVSVCDTPSSEHHLTHIYFFGIIDILQEFNAKKRMESTYKCIRYNKKAISAISSKAYATRFLDYMEQCIK